MIRDSRITYREPRRPFWERFWDLPGLAWIADDPLTACLAYLLIAAMLCLLGVVVWLSFQRGAF